MNRLGAVGVPSTISTLSSLYLVFLVLQLVLWYMSTAWPATLIFATPNQAGAPGGSLVFRVLGIFSSRVSRQHSSTTTITSRPCGRNKDVPVIAETKSIHSKAMTTAGFLCICIVVCGRLLSGLMVPTTYETQKLRSSFALVAVCYPRALD